MLYHLSHCPHSRFVGLCRHVLTRDEIKGRQTGPPHPLFDTRRTGGGNKRTNNDTALWNRSKIALLMSNGFLATTHPRPFKRDLCLFTVVVLTFVGNSSVAFDWHDRRPNLVLGNWLINERPLNGRIVIVCRRKVKTGSTILSIGFSSVNADFPISHSSSDPD